MWGSMVECFPGMHKVVGLVPSTVRRKEEKRRKRIEVEGRRGQRTQGKRETGVRYVPVSTA